MIKDLSLLVLLSAILFVVGVVVVHLDIPLGVTFFSASVLAAILSLREDT